MNAACLSAASFPANSANIFLAAELQKVLSRLFRAANLSFICIIQTGNSLMNCFAKYDFVSMFNWERVH